MLCMERTKATNADGTTLRLEAMPDNNYVKLVLKGLEVSHAAASHILLAESCHIIKHLNVRHIPEAPTAQWSAAMKPAKVGQSAVLVSLCISQTNLEVNMLCCIYGFPKYSGN